MSADKENKVLYEARLKLLRDQLTNLVGERKAGGEEATRKTALEMIKDGIPIDIIEKYTMLDRKEIEDLKKSL